MDGWAGRVLAVVRPRRGRQSDGETFGPTGLAGVVVTVRVGWGGRVVLIVRPGLLTTVVVIVAVGVTVTVAVDWPAGCGSAPTTRR